MKMQRIGDLVPDAVGREEVLKAGRAQAALRNWQDIVGEMLAARSAPERYDHGTVWVAVSGSAWAQELRMVKGQILKKLNEATGNRGLFTDMRFGVRPMPEAQVPEVEDTRARDYRDSIKDLSIKEIRERRMKKWSEG